jgi:predicted ABC-type ATPase
MEVDLLFKHKRRGGNKVAVFMCGASNVGKSTTRNVLLKDAGITRELVVLNIDEVRITRALTQREARVEFGRLVDKTIVEGYSFLYDATCRDRGRIIDLMKKLKQQGYKIIVGLVYATLHTVISRSHARIHQPMDESIVRAIYDEFADKAETYMKVPEIDEIYLYNNELKTRLLYSRKNNNIYCKINANANANAGAGDITQLFYFNTSKYCQGT